MTQRSEPVSGGGATATILLILLALALVGVWQWSYVLVRSPSGYQYFRVNRATGVSEVVKSRGYTRARGVGASSQSWTNYSN